MASTFSLFGVIHRVDKEACVAEKSIAPNICNYIGLRTTPQEAWYRVQQMTKETNEAKRMKFGTETMKPNDYCLFEATFTQEGLMHYATTNGSPGLPFLHQKLFNDGQHSNCWHFNGPLPLKAYCSERGLMLVQVDFIEFSG